jgi:regulator of ribonuclease E activity RraA/HMG-CHA aldolase family protein
MKAFDPDQFRDLSAAVLSDVMDTLGLMNQAMQPFVRPLDENLVLTGRARTGLYMPAYEVREGENPYEVEIALVDDLKPGDVPVLVCNGPTQRIAPWGELLSTAAQARGAAGCITDGLVRDGQSDPRDSSRKGEGESDGRGPHARRVAAEPSAARGVREVQDSLVSPRSDPPRGPSSALRHARRGLVTPHGADSRRVFSRELAEQDTRAPQHQRKENELCTG